MEKPHTTKKKVVDLRKCKPGQGLLTVHGTLLRYVRPLEEGSFYDHEVAYPNGGRGTRIHDGHVFRNPESRLATDEDIIEIIPMKKGDQVPIAQDKWEQITKKW